MKILLDLFLMFAKIGLFTFGGGYAMISMIGHNCVEEKKWISHDEMMNITVIAESTPGPIAINCSTYVGYKQQGFAGALAATFGIIVPSFTIIYLISMFLDNFLEVAIIANAFKGIKIAVSESTPGPIMVNLATYVGSSQAGFLGAALATLAVVLPSFLIILLVTAILKTALKNKYVQAILRGLKPCVIGIVLATGLYMVVGNCFRKSGDLGFDERATIITVVLLAVTAGYKKIYKKKLSPIAMIVVSAVIGIGIYGI